MHINGSFQRSFILFVSNSPEAIMQATSLVTQFAGAPVTRLVPKRKVHAVGYCLGGMPLAIAVAFLARNDDKRLTTLTLLASEVDFSEPGELDLFLDESQIACIEDMLRARGYLDGKQMAGTFALLNSRDLVWSKMVHEYLLRIRQPMTDLMAGNADATRMPYGMHGEHLRRLFLNNELSTGRYAVDGQLAARTDIGVPMFVVNTERDHVSPGRSVYKINLLTDTEVTFLLTSGGHNAGVVNPPANARVRFRVPQHSARDKYLDPELWAETASLHNESWWPHWQGSVAAQSGKRGAWDVCVRRIVKSSAPARPGRVLKIGIQHLVLDAFVILGVRMPNYADWVICWANASRAGSRAAYLPLVSVRRHARGACIDKFATGGHCDKRAQSKCRSGFFAFRGGKFA